MRALSNASAALVGRKPFAPIDGAKAELLDALNFALMHPTSTATGPKRIADVLTEEITKIERDRETGRADGIPTGIRVVDLITSGGLKRGSVNVFAARTGVGKTTLALNMAKNIAASGFPVCYFTVEMPAGQLARKLLSCVGEVRGSRVMSGKLEPIECDRLLDAATKLHKAPLWIDDTFMARFENFETACRRLKRQQGLEVVVIDYIQQLGMEGRFFSKQQLVTEVSHRVKQLALELELVVISLAQFNRDAEKLEGEPSIWHVKDSGAIEQDADLGVCLYRDVDGTFWLKFDKNRWGPDRNKFPIGADLAFNVFRDLDVKVQESF
jgi:replicative DNA helicase